MKPPPLAKPTRTSRGFGIIKFLDHYGTPCSVQQSSLAIPGTSALWIGVDDAQPKVLASQAAKYGIHTDETTGWVPYPIPEEVLLSTRMHLTREQVESLIDHLQTWLTKDHL